jgi:hypothetical protein
MLTSSVTAFNLAGGRNSWLAIAHGSPRLSALLVDTGLGCGNETKGRKGRKGRDVPQPSATPERRAPTEATEPNRTDEQRRNTYLRRSGRSGGAAEPFSFSRGVAEHV